MKDETVIEFIKEKTKNVSRIQTSTDKNCGT